MNQRRKSLKKDVNDDKAFRYSRDRHMGVSVSNEFYQPCPMFFSREGSQLNLIGLYRGASAFMISNGPSLLNHDLSLLNKPGIITYGMNNGPKTFRPNFWTCVDDPSRFLKSIWLDPTITKFIPQATFEKKIFDNEKWEMTNIKVGDCPNVIGYRRNEKFVADRFLFEDTINWGCHKDFGGGRSVMLPVFRILFLLGFRTVYLLGCDFNMSESNTYHFDEQRSKGAVKGNNNTYERLINDYLPKLKPIFDEVDFKIFNCNPESKLKCFPHKDYNEAIREATKGLGDVANERSWGMYSKPTEKDKWKNEPDEAHKKNLTDEKKKLLKEQQSRLTTSQSQKEQKVTDAIDVQFEQSDKKEEPSVVNPVATPIQQGIRLR